MNIVSAIAIILLIVSSPAHAQDSALLFKRDTLTIQRKPIIMLPWQTQKDAQEQPPLSINIELRDFDLYYRQKDWFNLQSLGNQSGVLFMFDANKMATIKPANQFSSLDILLIDAQGIIRQIVPSITLSSLKEEIVPKHPIRGLLFLKGGACKELKIKPGDYVDYQLFTTNPDLLSGDDNTIMPTKTSQRNVLIMQDKPRKKLPQHSTLKGAVTDVTPADK